jgi:hypothetical protein
MVVMAKRELTAGKVFFINAHLEARAVTLTYM